MITCLVRQSEICDMVKSVHGKKFDKKLIPHVKKVRPLRQDCAQFMVDCMTDVHSYDDPQPF